MNSRIIFKESQRFTQWWLWLLLLFPFFYIVYDIVQPLLDGFQHGSCNTSFSLIMPSDAGIGIFLYVLTLLFFALSRLQTVVTKDTIAIRHLLFAKKVIKLNDVAEAKLCKYGFVGYGIRLSIKYGTVYNVKGNKGFALTLQNGARYLIGTQQPHEFYKAVKKNMV